ncbi:hypothetical protein PICMEDRAFT_56587 [Pichia membranifaciens NRRL Y-2026]|uniref:Uncharacterized protein n=1 Tax=Pichia membranifaciens NRRL Y-2026 TaxID=763406 RepID=A0A1E3NDE7_9ASCO|nr:hypothetical protein PICMEDRAFT_56587 [Pichia membranifaciens NRRL Y-2026]ODQ44142.1 hypothetical protein PICMEDRAFT_56587 [Pichia membranifaciens NRRL Y-2026]
MLSALLQKIVEANDLLHTEEDHLNRSHTSSNLGTHNNSSKNNNTNTSNTTFDSTSGGGLLNSKYGANVLAFHGRNIPAISLHAYLTRILKYCPVTNDVFLSLLVYFDRIAKQNNDEGPQVFVMDSYNIHRLIISGITVASKFFSDVFYKNSRYAKVGGLPLDELNHLELQFLLLLDFQLMIQKEELERYGDLLLRFWKREQIKRMSTNGMESQPLQTATDSDNAMTDQ